MKNIILLTTIIFSYLSVSGQYYSEGFEDGALPAGWSFVHVKENVDWEYQNGGHKANPNEFDRRPYPAHGGSYNALFQKESFSNPTTKLITSKIDISMAVKPVLHFWHAQARRYYFNAYTNDELKVYYRISEISPWVQLAYYPDSQATWTERIIPIPDSARSNSFYLAFEGISKPGWGTCVDDISIVETGTADVSIESVNLSQDNNNLAYSFTTKNPIVRLAILVRGNVGTKTLDSICFTSLNTNDNDISNNGVRLFRTVDSVFKNPVQMSVRKNFSSGKVSFSGLSYNLPPTGYSYFWLVYDLDSTATIDNHLDAKITSNSIKISNQYYPSTEISPTGYKTIKQSIFFDGFETNKGWAFTGEFEIDTPLIIPYGGSKVGNPDPSEAFDGSIIIGTDITGLGIDSGDYEKNIANRAYLATSPVFDCFFFKDVQLEYMRWLNIDVNDSAIIDVSTDSGATWQKTWVNTNFHREKVWNANVVDLSTKADRKKNVKIRFAIGPTNETWQFSGWNIDNVTITGKYIHNDVGVSKWVSPITECGHTTHDTVKVYIKNYGPKISKDTIPVAYTFDGGLTFQRDTLFSAIDFEDSVLFTFTPTVDLSKPFIYENVWATTELSVDDDNRNDITTTNLMSLPTYKLPFAENFDDTIYWRSLGPQSKWALGYPDKNSINSTYSGYNCWITDLLYNYPNNNTSYLESPCFNFYGIVKPIFELKYISQLELNKDGVALQYSTDGGTNWNLVPKHGYQWHWNWYSSNSITALGTAGWDTTTSSWTTAKQILPDALAGASSVKFRFAFKSDAANNNEGFAIDDVKVYEAPAVTGATSISSHANNCQFVNPEKISFYIRNNGIRSMYPTKDTIIAGFQINGNPTVFDTIQLPAILNAGSTMQLTFNKKAVMDTPGNYTIKVFTMDKYPDFYYPLENNDSIEKTITIYANPIVNLPDTFKSAHLNTFKITPYYNTAYNYEWSNQWRVISTDSVLEAPPAGKIWLKATIKDVNGCNTTDTFFMRKLIPNLAVKNLLGPQNSCKLENNEHLSFSVLNVGDDTLNIGEKMKFGFKIDKLALNSEEHILTKTVYPGDSISYTFTAPVNFSNPDTYQVKTIATYMYDSIPANDTLTTQLYVWGFPKVSVGNDTTVNGFYTMDAGPGFKTYMWDNIPEETNRTYKVSTIGKHWVDVTDIHDCPASASANIIVYINNIQPIEISNPTSSCELTSNEKIKLKIKNIGTIDIPSADTIAVKYSLDGDTWVKDTIHLSNPFIAGDTIEFTFNKIENFSAIKDYNIVAVVNLRSDIDDSNDTIKSVISVYGKPEFSLGQDSTVKAFSYTFNPPDSSSYNYLWQDGSTNRQYVVTNTGNYTLKITETVHNCSFSDAALITISILDGALSTATIDSIDCSNEFDSIQVSFKNLGNTVFTTDSTISLICEINETNQILATKKVNSDLSTGDSILISFKNLKNTIVPGKNTFKIYPVLTGDLRPENDTLNFSINIYEPPIVDLGGIDDTLKVTSGTILDAGEGSGYSYLWHNGTTNRTITALLNGYYYVTVTTPKGCFERDTVYTFILYHDGGINAVTANSTCINNFNDFSAEYINHSQLTIPAGDSIQFGYILNKNTTFLQWVVLNSDLVKNAKFTHTFTNMKNKVITGTNKFKVFANTKGDTIAKNDTMSFSVILNPLPTVDLGQDIINVMPPVVINAGVSSGYSYLWQDGSTSNTYTATKNGKYYVRVTNNITQCSASDTVIVFCEYNDGAITSFTGNSSGCTGNYGSLSVEITNQGSSDLPAGETVSLGLDVNNINKITEKLQLSNAMKPTEKITHTFSSVDQYLVTGTNKLKAYITVENDLYRSNDSISKTIVISDYPIINLAGGNETISFKGSYLLSAGSGFESYIWSNASTSQSIIVNSGGWYKVTVSNAAGCKSSDSVFFVKNVGLNSSITENNLIIYPNPAAESVNIEIKDISLTNPLLEIFDTDMKFVFYKKFEGKQVENKLHIDLNNFSKGIYLIKISDDDKKKVYTRKLVIK